MNRIVEPGNSLDLSVGTGVTQTFARLSVQPAILAGGAGTRLWPLSRERSPKQLIGPISDASVLEATLSRLDDALAVAAHSMPPTGRFAAAAPLVVCCEALRLQTRERLAQCGRQVRVVLEPQPRNTAPALTVAALAARAAGAGDDDPVIVAVPADHAVADHEAFGVALAEALTHAVRGAIVTFGVPPRRAATAYGYIRTGTTLGTRGARAIVRFVEKPDGELAERYVASGDYWWTSGIFVVRASVWLSAIGLCRPVIAAACADAFRHATEDSDGALHLACDACAACPSDSIDYAVMERIATDARLVGVTVPLIAGWSDVGANPLWDASVKDDAGNVAGGHVEVMASRIWRDGASRVSA
ncbi:sugar phosphate nucleotidyltransferase [Paraburkholderia sediminicola]|uniref:Sugar phosphate nucleotidyltransferase n=1 Tax=Paraburkholderia rhynchosiae TaxID=487049 RepID=A0ACC7NL92_9BURK